ncbi:MAG: alkaline phosphatase family protein [Mucinivorans sp.]
MKNYILIFIASILSTILSATTAIASPPTPRLVVQITVSGMRYDYLLRFGHNFTDQGFKRLTTQGALCERAMIGYLNTSTAPGLATIVTGANPSSHGVIGSHWFNYTTSEKISLVEDKKVHTIGADELDAQVSPRAMIASTTGDCIKSSSPRSKVISIAFEPLSAVVAGGFEADGAYWVSPRDGKLVSSSYYTDKLPEWVDKFNALNLAESYSSAKWEVSRPASSYFNILRSVISADTSVLNFDFLTRKKYEYERLAVSPFGNSLIKDFATQAVIYENLGKDASTDFLSVVFDGPRQAGEKFGTSSMEVEDIFYRLDAELGSFLDFLVTQVGRENLLVVLTSDHGLCSPYIETARSAGGRFDVSQFSVLINGFLGAQLTQRIAPSRQAAAAEGDQRWVLDVINNQVYLNRKRIYQAGLDLSEVQQLVADFAIQFRGVSDAITARNLQSAYFAGGTLGKAQNGYFARHSGDVTINLLPGWSVSDGGISQGGSQYIYDTHVPIIFFGGAIAPDNISREVSLTDIAPTIAHLVGVAPPNAATGVPIREIYIK